MPADDDGYWDDVMLRGDPLWLRVLCPYRDEETKARGLGCFQGMANGLCLIGALLVTPVALIMWWLA